MAPSAVPHSQAFCLNQSRCYETPAQHNDQQQIPPRPLQQSRPIAGGRQPGPQLRANQQVLSGPLATHYGYVQQTAEQPQPTTQVPTETTSDTPSGLHRAPGSAPSGVTCANPTPRGFAQDSAPSQADSASLQTRQQPLTMAPPAGATPSGRRTTEAAERVPSGGNPGPRPNAPSPNIVTLQGPECQEGAGHREARATLLEGPPGNEQATVPPGSTPDHPAPEGEKAFKDLRKWRRFRSANRTLLPLLSVWFGGQQRGLTESSSQIQEREAPLL